MAKSSAKKGVRIPKTTVNKGLLVFLLLLFIGAALVLIPSINHNVSTGISVIKAQGDQVYQNSSQYSTIFDTLKYGRSIHILAMLLVGFGFLMVFVRKHGYSSLTATLLVVSIAIPMYMIIKSFDGEGFSKSI